MKRKILSLVLSIAVVVSLLAGCGGMDEKEAQGGETSEEAQQENKGKDDSGNDESFNITAGGIQAAEDSVTLAMQKMADIAKEKSNGTINITVSPAGQLGDATSQMEAVSLGTQEMFVDAGSWLSTFVDDALVTSMFFLFRDEEHYKEFLKSDICKDFEQQLIDQQGIRVIANNWLRAPRSIVSTVPISSVDDLKGLKMRVPDIKTYLESVDSLGMGAAQVAWGETYLALQQGVVDAGESPLDAIYTMKFHEIAPHIIVTEHVRDNVQVYMNDGIFNQMSDAQKTAISEAALEAGEWYSSQTQIVSEDYIKRMEEEGAEFSQPSEKMIEEMTEIVKERAEKLESEGMWKAGLFQDIQGIGQ